jgi:hypothetical protein
LTQKILGEVRATPARSAAGFQFERKMIAQDLSVATASGSKSGHSANQSKTPSGSEEADTDSAPNSVPEFGALMTLAC